MKDIKKITVTKGDKTLLINNPTKYPLIGRGSQGAVFQISQDRCVKVYADPIQAKMEAEALKAGQHLPFFPRLYKSGENYVVMEYFDGPNLKEYLKNCTYMPESITRKLLDMLKAMEKTGFTMVDAPLRHIFVMENEELKAVDHVNAFKRQHPVPLKLLRDLNIILLKDSFLSQVERLEPEMYKKWNDCFEKGKVDFKEVAVRSGGSGKGVKVESNVPLSLIGKGHQGVVFRISEDRCVKIYGKREQCEQEKKVLLTCQELSFIPEVYETGPNYVVMEFLSGPDLNTFLKTQTHLPLEVTKELLNILTLMKENGFKLIDAPLRHIFITKNGFKMVDHVYSFTREQSRPLELFQDLYERGFLDDFLEQMKMLDPETHAEWTKEPIPLEEKVDNTVQIIQHTPTKDWKMKRKEVKSKDWKKKKKHQITVEKDDKKKKKKKDKKKDSKKKDKHLDVAKSASKVKKEKKKEKKKKKDKKRSEKAK